MSQWFLKRDTMGQRLAKMAASEHALARNILGALEKASDPKVRARIFEFSSMQMTHAAELERAAIQMTGRFVHTPAISSHFGTDSSATMNAILYKALRSEEAARKWLPPLDGLARDCEIRVQCLRELWTDLPTSVRRRIVIRSRLELLRAWAEIPFVRFLTGLSHFVLVCSYYLLGALFRGRK